MPADVEPVSDELTENAPAAATGAQLAVSTIATKMATAGLWCCLLMAPVGLALGGFAVWQSPSPSAPATAAAVDLGGDRIVAGEFAERLVVAWLGATSGDSDELSSLITQENVVSLPEQPQAVTNVEVASIEPADEAWSVTVAATVTGAKDVPSRRFYQVPVVVSAGSVAALSLPAPVGGPVVAASPKLDYRETLTDESLVSDTVGQFLAAYLSGVGDVSRYVSPGVSITAIDPPVFREVTVEDLTGNRELVPGVTPRDEDTIQVLVVATGVVSKTQSVTVQYSLSLTARAQRWEITAIDPAPALSPQTAEPSPDGLGGSTDSSQSTITP